MPAGGDMSRARTERERRYDEYMAALQEEEETIRLMFENKYVRQQFVRKVYSILFVQLAITMGIMLFFRLHRPTCLFVIGPNAGAFWWSCMGISFGVIIVLVCCSKVRHIFPINLILLMLFTIVEGLILGGATCFSRTDIFLMAVGITGAVCMALSLFAMQTRCDFTPFGGIMLVFLVVLMILGLVQFFVRDKILHLVYASLGAFIFGVYLIIDTQMIMGGNHQYTIAPDEYILGALQLYLDVIMMFMMIYNLLTGFDS